MKLSVILASLALIFGIGLIVQALKPEPTNPNAHHYRVLFIGNSLTSTNDLPKMIAQIARSHNNSLDYTTYAIGGATFATFTQDKKLTEVLTSKPFDVIVLQEQSQRPSFGESQLQRDVFPFAAQLVDAIHHHQPNARIMFYETMARRNGDVQNQRVYPELATYEGTQQRINQTYRKLMTLHHADLAPVGEVWQMFRKHYPTIDLYADDTHPNPLGSYLAACVFYTRLYQQPCIHASAPRSLDGTTVSQIQQFVDDWMFQRKQP